MFSPFLIQFIFHLIIIHLTVATKSSSLRQRNRKLSTEGSGGKLKGFSSGNRSLLEMSKHDAVIF